jgi:hypothetical protein
MTDVLDREITVTVLISAAPVEQQGFDQVLYLAQPGTVMLLDDVTRFTTSQEVAAARAAGDITQRTADALTTAMAQKPRTGTLALAKTPATNTNKWDIVLGGTTASASDTFTVITDGYTATFTATGGETPSQIADALASLVDALPGQFTASAEVSTLSVSSDFDGIPIEVLASKSSAGITLTGPTLNTAADDPAASLDAILAGDDAWYGLATEVKSRAYQKDVATWAEANKRLYLPQTSTPSELASDPLSILEWSASNSLDYTAVCYHHDDTEDFAYAWAVRKLGSNLDAKSVDWAWATLSGVTASTLTTTQADHLESFNGNYYQRVRGRSAAWRGTVATGLTLENRLSIDWLEDRLQEANANLLLDASAREEKIPYTDDGFSHVRAVNLEQMERSVTAGHVTRQRDGVTGAVTSPVVSVPRRSNVSSADETAARVPVTIDAVVSSSAQRVAVTVYLSTSV